MRRNNDLSKWKENEPSKVRTHTDIVSNFNFHVRLITHPNNQQHIKLQKAEEIEKGLNIEPNVYLIFRH